MIFYITNGCEIEIIDIVLEFGRGVFYTVFKKICTFFRFFYGVFISIKSVIDSFNLCIIFIRFPQ